MIIRHSLVRSTLIVLLLAWIPAAAQTRATLPADKIEKIEKAITAAMSRQNIPGLSVAVVTDQRLRWSQGYGLADLENFIPAQVCYGLSPRFYFKNNHSDSRDAAGRARQARFRRADSKVLPGLSAKAVADHCAPIARSSRGRSSLQE